MRTTTTLVLMIGMTMTLCAAAGAATPRRVCRESCAPRVAEQCEGLTGRPLRRCRKGLVRACRRTSPTVACTTTAEMTQRLTNLAMKVPATSAGLTAALELCPEQRFSVETSSPDSFVGAAAGSWAIVIADGTLALDLAVDPTSGQDTGTSPRFTVTLDDAGIISFDGAPVDTLDARSACALDGPGSPNGPDFQAITDLLGNKALRTEVSRTVGGSTTTERQDATLCSSGGVHLRTLETTTPASGLSGIGQIDNVQGSWSVQFDADGLFLQLELDDDATGTTETRRLALAVGDDGSIEIDGNLATVSDASQACGVLTPAEQADRELEGRLKGALRDRVLVTVRAVGPTRRFSSVLVVCASGHFSFEATDSGPPVFTASTTGTFTVHVEAGVATLSLRPDSGGSTIDTSVGLDDAGDVLLNGLPAAIGDAGLVAQVCS